MIFAKLRVVFKPRYSDDSDEEEDVLQHADPDSVP